MKRFFGKRWHRIPVALVSVLLILALTAGGVFAAYPFFTSTATVTVVEAVAVGAGTWDNLEPYGLNEGSLDDVNIEFGVDELIITTAAETPYVGEGFCPGEWIVIPLNIRNGSDGELTLGAIVVSDGLAVDASYVINTGAETDPIPAGHEGECLAYNFKAPPDSFSSLTTWSEVVPGNSGFSGSAVHGAQVLFVKISAPGDMAPGNYTVTITLSRS